MLKERSGSSPIDNDALKAPAANSASGVILHSWQKQHHILPKKTLDALSAQSPTAVAELLAGLSAAEDMGLDLGRYSTVHRTELVLASRKLAAMAGKTGKPRELLEKSLPEALKSLQSYGITVNREALGKLDHIAGMVGRGKVNEFMDYYLPYLLRKLERARLYEPQLLDTLEAFASKLPMEYASELLVTSFPTIPFIQRGVRRSMKETGDGSKHVMRFYENGRLFFTAMAHRQALMTASGGKFLETENCNLRATDGSVRIVGDKEGDILNYHVEGMGKRSLSRVLDIVNAGRPLLGEMGFRRLKGVSPNTSLVKVIQARWGGTVEECELPEKLANEYNNAAVEGLADPRYVGLKQGLRLVTQI